VPPYKSVTQYLLTVNIDTKTEYCNSKYFLLKLFYFHALPLGVGHPTAVVTKGVLNVWNFFLRNSSAVHFMNVFVQRKRISKSSVYVLCLVI